MGMSAPPGEEVQDGGGARGLIPEDQVLHAHGHIAVPELACAEVRRAQVHPLPQPHLHHDALAVALGA